ncbi:MAG TPA: class I tRNA ligase family protein, partial [Candidatus Poseidoniales archaeon]|nr:class I tRNA ligase family protein [Candidatus Poseidoniales archaeon]
AENAAKEVGGHPRAITEQNIVTITEQLQRMGFSYDWNREVRTHTPEYYRWNQWLFLELDKAGLVERRMATVNWDPVEQSVLANEQVINGRGWRSGALVEQREIPQWFLRITAYADELLSNLETIDFPENVATMQENWIGRSEGADIHFQVAGTEHIIEVFTTRPDTIFGVTFLTLAPTHPLTEELVSGTEYESGWRELVARVNNMTEHELGASKDKHGVFLGCHAIHPFTDEMIPIWAGDFVLASYGTGAVMGVPAHDERDFAFAVTHCIDVKEVLLPSKDHQSTPLEEAYTGEGWMVNSGLDGFDGLYGDAARSAVIESLEAREKGVRQIQWRLRDWLISRQRYWGTPIPILYDEDGEPHHVPEGELPVQLPDDVTFDHEGGGNPIARSPTFGEVRQSDGSVWCRETDT